MNQRPARKVYKNNRTGIAGVECRNGKFVASIRVGGQRHRLGFFEAFFDACCARKSAENRFNPV